MMIAETKKDAVRAWIEDNAHRSNFAASLAVALDRYGSLTHRQRAAAERIIDRDAAKARINSQHGKSLKAIVEVFSAAKASGLKRPVLRVRSLKLSLAPENGRNAGYVYVKSGGEYAGKISPDGTFYGNVFSGDGFREALREISDDPLAAAVKHGRETGVCACCGRELTDPKSVELGIGPVCKEKWSL